MGNILCGTPQSFIYLFYLIFLNLAIPFDKKITFFRNFFQNAAKALTGWFKMTERERTM